MNGSSINTLISMTSDKKLRLAENKQGKSSIEIRKNVQDLSFSCNETGCVFLVGDMARYINVYNYKRTMFR